MLLYLTLEGVDSIVLPNVNLHMVQAMLYDLLPEPLGTFLHDQGFITGRKRFKLFAFSWLRGQGQIRFKNGQLAFRPPLTLVVSSPVEQIVASFAEAVIKRNVRIGENRLVCSAVKVVSTDLNADTVLVYTLSPVVCYSTLYRGSSPFAEYYSPFEEKFAFQIAQNLSEKYLALHPDSSPPEGRVIIRPVSEVRQQVARFKPSDPRPIKGWWGRFRLDGPRQLLKVALDCGLGAKNSAGFGCVEACEGEFCEKE